MTTIGGFCVENILEGVVSICHQTEYLKHSLWSYGVNLKKFVTEKSIVYFSKQYSTPDGKAIK